ncbi:hypothetical protein Acy02nite_55410 [Actinoplanes cyaneus]|uniref:Uncharacterized protein n=1 Tax=Actinoplanes cyaneus TaxID=52696 RepID=A0A919ITB6_9ACTN|nr:hypothetical protein [Actinoplanes cyaneus]GID67660.1 hypothetical protein Acy02nite_55410 [Actinoplanes cyaneus]
MGGTFQAVQCLLQPSIFTDLLKGQVFPERKFDGGISAIWYTPTDREWEAGERRARCFVYLTKRAVRGSLAGIGPSGL